MKYDIKPGFKYLQVRNPYKHTLYDQYNGMIYEVVNLRPYETFDVELTYMEDGIWYSVSEKTGDIIAALDNGDYIPWTQ